MAALTTYSMSHPPATDPTLAASPGPPRQRRGIMGRPIGRALRALRRLAGMPTPQPLLPMLIRVYAGFTKLDGDANEEEIESSLAFMRHDYPEAVYSELLTHYRDALREPQDLDSIADHLRPLLTHDEKIQLAAQLCVLITRSDQLTESLAALQAFADRLGISAAAKDIAGQLTEESAPDAPDIPHTLERIEIGNRPPADLILENAGSSHALTVFRFQNLILIRNSGSATIIARGRQLAKGACLRLYEGQRIVVGEHILDYQDLIFYLNAKKGVNSTQLYLGISGTGAPFIERERSRLSVLRIRFGLAVEVAALRSSALLIGGLRLQQGQRCTATQGERIIFPDTTEITFAELRRRAREMGGRFDLSPTRSQYLVSNNPALLRDGDILLSPSLRNELLLRITCHHETETGQLEIVKSTRPILLAGTTLREKDTTPLSDGAVIDLGEGQYLRCRFSDGIIEEERNIIRELEIRDLTHSFSRGRLALDNISLHVRRGEMICIMGPSGCGKSSLLRVLAGHTQPQKGRILMNGKNLYTNLETLTPLISFIPHEDAFDPLLTVQENLHCAASIRSPHISSRDISRRVDAKLIELGLNERRHRTAGTPDQKILSSGQRKRLNIGLDMITPADVFLFDEPTSGLSSKDSEHVLEIIRGLAHNKIVFVSIHQPSARLFRKFHKAALLDHGGRLVYFGTPTDMLAYFGDAWEEQFAQPAKADDVPPPPKPDFHQPEFIFDVLEAPLRDPSGDVLCETDSSGHLAPARRFPPDFWQDRFHAHMVMEDDTQTPFRREETALGAAPPPPTISTPRDSPRERLQRLAIMVRRAFLSRLRNRGNMVTTLLEAPLLAALIAFVLRYSEDGTYTFASAFHIPTWLFLSLVVAMFLGLTNSADEIIRDRILLQRERNYNTNVAGYILSKMLSLGSVSIIQSIIYLLIGNAILEIHGVFLHHLMWMSLTSLCGVSIGLLISSLVRDARTALNIVPLILIPQIILGGALIKYEEMNRNLDFAYSMRRWSGQSEDTSDDKPSKLRVPLICDFMPLRWSYENLVLSQAHHNPLTEAQEEVTNIIHKLGRPSHLTPAHIEVLTTLTAEATHLTAQLQPTAALTPDHLKDLNTAITNARDRILQLSPTQTTSTSRLTTAFTKLEDLLRDYSAAALTPELPALAAPILTRLTAAVEMVKIASEPDPEILKRLTQAKEANAKIFGLEERNPDALMRRMARIVAQVKAGTYDPAQPQPADTTCRAETVFVNQKIYDLVYKAEMERVDKRRSISPNVFFGRKKNYQYGFDLFGKHWSLLDLSTDTIPFNGAILLGWVFMPLGILFIILRRQLRRV